MNVAKIKYLSLAIGVVGMYGTLSVPVLMKYGVRADMAFAFFTFMLGIMATGVIFSFAVDDLYIPQTFRLHGWRDGKYGIKMKVRPGEGITPCEYPPMIFRIGSNNPDMPRSPDWKPHGKDQVIVCGHVYTADPQSLDSEKAVSAA